MSSAYYSPLVSDDLIWEVARMFFPSRMNVPALVGEGREGAVRLGKGGRGIVGRQDWMGWGWMICVNTVCVNGG